MTYLEIYAVVDNALSSGV